MDEQAKFNQLLARMQDDVDMQNKFLSNPSAILNHLNIPVIDNLRFPKVLSNHDVESQVLAELVFDEQTNTTTNAPSITISKHWWGINIQWSDAFTLDYINNLVKLDDMSQQIKLAAKAAKMHAIDATLAHAFAMAFMAKSVNIRLTNKKKGVHWPLTWAQLGLVAAKPGVISALTYSHPLHN